jgi:hypothetical protein
MAVKPAPGETILQETRTRIESNLPPSDPDKLPPFWEYIDSLNEADWASGGYRFILERGRKELKSDERSYIGDFFEKLTPADIAKRWGGGDYTIWFKVPPKGQQLKYKIGLKIDGAPLSSTGGASASSYSSNGQSSDPLMRLVDLMDRRFTALEAKLETATGSGAASAAVQQAVGLTGRVFEAATAAATGTLSNIAGGTRAPQNTLEETLTILAKAKEIFGPPAGGPVSNSVKDFLEMLTAIKGAGLLGAPAGAGSTVAQLAIEGIRVLPAAISEGVKGLEHWHLAEEARARQVAIMRGQNPNPINVTPQPAAATAPPPPPPVNAAASPAAAPPAGGPTVEVNIEVIEQGLVRILNNQSYTIEEAAHRAAAMMEDLVPGMPDRVANAGEAQILQLFQTRPILLNVPQNPRLTEFIKKFIEVVKSAPVMTAQQPANVPPA